MVTLSEYKTKSKATNNKSDLLKKLLNKKGAISSSQHRFWLLHNTREDKSICNVPIVLKISSPLDFEKLSKALERIVDKHEILKATFHEESNIVYRKINKHIKTTLNVINPSKTPITEKECLSLLTKTYKTPFDLTTGPLFNFTLIWKDEKTQFLILNFHHIIFDGKSSDIFIRELKKQYEHEINKQKKKHNKTTIQYDEYIASEKNLSKEKLDIYNKKINWWKDKLINLAENKLDLPFDKTLINNKTTKSHFFSFKLNKEKHAILKKIANDNNTSLFNVFLSIFQLFLEKISNKNDILIGVPTSGRTNSKFLSTIGCFINTLPIRIQSEFNTSFIQHLSKVTEETQEAFLRQEIPFEKISEESIRKHSISSEVKINAMLNMSPKVKTKQIGSSKIELVNFNRGHSHYDINLSIHSDQNTINCSFEFAQNQFTKRMSKSLKFYFLNLLNQVCDNPNIKIETLNLLGEEGHLKLIKKTNIIYPSKENHKNLIEVIEKNAENHPDDIAIACDGKNYTYKEINDKANKVAHFLIDRGIKKEDKVIVNISRSEKFMIVILGVLKAGGTYVPFDPSQPEKRLNFIYDDLKAFYIISDEKNLYENTETYKHLSYSTINHKNSNNPKILINSNQLAYIIYTSGTTGKPKGVGIDHNSLNDRLFWKISEYPHQKNEGFLHTYSFMFDGAIINYFWPLCVGGKLVIPNKNEQISPSDLIKLIKKHNVTNVDLLPSLLDCLLPNKEFLSCTSLKNVFSGGEALKKATISSFLERCPQAKLHNTYGPTEATIECSVWNNCTTNFNGNIAPIGKSIASSKLFILDKHKNIVPLGIKGELYIGGIGLTKGYINDPEKTQKKFIKGPFNFTNCNTLYKTGDLARYSHDGNIEFIGRIDNQVKVRGFRIELEEIESTISQLTIVRKAVVQVDSKNGTNRIVAYIKLNTKKKIPDKIIKAQLSKILPNYMIPSKFILIEKFPELPNGKIDVNALSYYLNSEEKSPPQNILINLSNTQRSLFDIWKTVLDYEFDINDNFFEIGGDSLLAVRLIMVINDKLDLNLSLTQLYLTPTISSLSELIYSNSTYPKASLVTPLKKSGKLEPLFLIHPVGGNILCYNNLVNNMGINRPIYGIQSVGFNENEKPLDCIYEMAKVYTNNILKIQEDGPYYLGGWSFGGIVAAEIANILISQGKSVEFLAIIDSSADRDSINKLQTTDEKTLLLDLVERFNSKNTRITTDKNQAKEHLVKFVESGNNFGEKDKEKERNLSKYVNIIKKNYAALKAYKSPYIQCENILIIKSKENKNMKKDLGWNKYLKGKTYLVEIEGNHWGVTKKILSKTYADIISKFLT